MVIVPTRFLNEIKNQPENILSFQKQVSERFIGKYTGLGVNDTLVHSVKIDLTKNIVRILGELQEEVDFAVGQHIGDCKGMLSFLQPRALLIAGEQTGSQCAFTPLYLHWWRFSPGASSLASR